MATSASAPIAFTGDDKAQFIKASLRVWVDFDGAGLVYVGKTKPEKQLSPGVGVAEFWDNSSGVQSLFIVDPDKVDMKMSFAFAQVVNENVLALALNADIDRDSDANNNIVNVGSNPGAFREGKWYFTTQSRTGRIITLTVRRGIVQPTGNIAIGTPGSYAECPMELRFLQDTSIVDTSKDLAYWTIQKAVS